MICGTCGLDLGYDPESISGHIDGDCKKPEVIERPGGFYSTSPFKWPTGPVVFELNGACSEVRDGETITILLPVEIDFGSGKIRLTSEITFENKGGVMVAATDKTILRKD